MGDTSLAVIREEIEVLEAIFCGENEFTLHTNLDAIKDDVNFDICFSVNVKLDDGHDVLISLNLDSTYPEKIRNFSLNSTNYCRTQLAKLKNELIEYLANAFSEDIKEPKILQLIDRIREVIKTYELKGNVFHPNRNIQQENITSHDDDDDDNKIVVLKLDHMRAKQKYTKIILKWTKELSLSGCLIFHGKLIWIILFGPEISIKEYIKYHRTCNVDIDSNGKACKERMMDIVLERDFKKECKKLDGFHCVELQSKDDLAKLLIQYAIDLEELL